MKTGIYSEDGWKARVEILEDNSDAKYDSYKIKVIETLLESTIYKTPPDGDVFNILHNKNYGMCCWDLEIQESL